MQTKIWLSFAFLIMFSAAYAQQSYYTAVANRAGLPEREASFNFTVVADKQSPSFVLYVNNPEQKKISLQISHRVNGLAADTSFTSKSFSSRYNFEQADDGSYFVTLTSGKEKIRKKVEINTVTTRNVVVD